MSGLIIAIQIILLDWLTDIHVSCMTDYFFSLALLLTDIAAQL